MRSIKTKIVAALVAIITAGTIAYGMTVQTSTGSFFGLTSGVSGGIPYFSATNTAASSAVLASTGIVLGGGAGAAPVTATGCTIGSNTNPACTSAVAFGPQLALTNTTNDTSSPFIFGNKNRAGGNTSSGDTLFTITSQGFANAAQRSAASIAFAQAAAVSGNNVPSKITLAVTDASGSAGLGAVLDNNVHLKFTNSGVPGVSGCGTGSPTVTAGSTDVAGEVTDGTTATGCVLTFKVAYTTAPFCVVAMQTQQAAFSWTVSTTAITTTHTSASGLKWNYICSGA